MQELDNGQMLGNGQELDEWWELGGWGVDGRRELHDGQGLDRESWS